MAVVVVFPTPPLPEQMRMVRVVDTRVLLGAARIIWLFGLTTTSAFLKALDDGGFNGDHAILELGLFGQTRLGTGRKPVQHAVQP